MNRKAWLLALIAFALLLPMPCKAATPAIKGQWTGQWYSMYLKQSGNIIVSIKQVSTTISGTVYFPGSTCPGPFAFRGNVTSSGKVIMNGVMPCGGYNIRFVVNGWVHGNRFAAGGYGQSYAGEWYDFGSFVIRR